MDLPTAAEEIARQTSGLREDQLTRVTPGPTTTCNRCHATSGKSGPAGPGRGQGVRTTDAVIRRGGLARPRAAFDRSGGHPRWHPTGASAYSSPKPAWATSEIRW